MYSMTLEQPMFTTDLVNLFNRNISKTSLYIYIFQDEKYRLMLNLSLSMATSFKMFIKYSDCLKIYKSSQFFPLLLFFLGIPVKFIFRFELNNIYSRNNIQGVPRNMTVAEYFKMSSSIICSVV